MSAAHHPPPDHVDFHLGDLANPNEFVKCLIANARVLQAMCSVCSNRITKIELMGNILRIYIQSDPAGQLVASTFTPDALEATAQELRANAAKSDPQSHDVALTTPKLASPLRAIARYRTETDPPVTYHTADAVYEIPRLSMGDFIEPKKDQQYSKHVTVLITGIYIVSKDQTSHMKTREELHIRMDAALAKEINPETFGRTLGKTYFAGEITRGENNEWTTVPGGRLCHQDQLTGFDSTE